MLSETKAGTGAHRGAAVRDKVLERGALYGVSKLYLLVFPFLFLGQSSVCDLCVPLPQPHPTASGGKAAWECGTVGF